MARMTLPVWLAAAAAVSLAVPVVSNAQTPPAPVTFSKDVAPIFQAKCQSCHEPGSIAPMSLANLQGRAAVGAIDQARASQSRQMPPWHIDRSVGVQKFKNDMSLTDEQVDTIVNWVDQGAPEGNPADFTPKPVATGLYWQAERDGFGPPDLVVKRADADHAGGAPGRVVASGDRDPDHRTALGQDGRDPSGQHRGPQDPAPLDRVSHPQSRERRRGEHQVSAG